MPSAVLTGYPAVREEAVLDAVASVLADDPTIVALAPPLTLWLLDGDPEQDDHPAESQLPCVRLTLGPYPSGQYTENAHKGTLSIFLDCYAPGRHRTDQMRVAGVVVGAIFPADPTRAAVVKARYQTPGFVFASIRRMADAAAQLPEGRWATRVRLQLDVTIIKGTL